MVLCAPLLAGWAVFALSQGNIWLLYLGRVLQGLGVMSSVTQVYLVEIADTERRGLFGASGALSVSVGITLVYCLGVSNYFTSINLRHLYQRSSLDNHCRGCSMRQTTVKTNNIWSFYIRSEDLDD